VFKNFAMFLNLSTEKLGREKKKRRTRHIANALWRSAAKQDWLRPGSFE
jgi:hypothetical protein